MLKNNKEVAKEVFKLIEEDKKRKNKLTSNVIILILSGFGIIFGIVAIYNIAIANMEIIVDVAKLKEMTNMLLYSLLVIHSVSYILLNVCIKIIEKCCKFLSQSIKELKELN